MDDLFEYELDGIPLQTGDLICTRDGSETILAGEFWKIIGTLIPGEVDHVAVYLGPKGRCVEAGPHGVFLFEIKDGRWGGDSMFQKRGIVDQLHGVTFPLRKRKLGIEATLRMRIRVAKYCLRQVGKPYNLNFFDPETAKAFYCSQLAYKAYQSVGIDLNTSRAISGFPLSQGIVYPQEIWDKCEHEKPRKKQ
jgi:uncharacterized protein YycO